MTITKSFYPALSGHERLLGDVKNIRVRIRSFACRAERAWSRCTTVCFSIHWVYSPIDTCIRKQTDTHARVVWFYEQFPSYDVMAEKNKRYHNNSRAQQELGWGNRTMGYRDSNVGRFRWSSLIRLGGSRDVSEASCLTTCRVTFCRATWKTCANHERRDVSGE